MNQIVRAALTEREADVAELLLQGCSNPEIADALGIAQRTVKQYMRQMFAKCQVQSPDGRDTHGSRIRLARALLALPVNISDLPLNISE